MHEAFTRTGQLTLLRRVTGSAVKSENYDKVDIKAGTVAAAPPAPRAGFN